MRKTAVETLWEVTLRSGRVVQGTERELNAQLPDANWKRAARPVRVQAPHKTQDDSAIIDLAEQDFADDPRPGRVANSSVRYAGRSGQRIRIEDRPNYAVPRRAHRETEDRAEVKPRRRKRGFLGFLRGYPFVAIIAGMAMMALLAYTISSVGAWWQMHQQDVEYGRPRTYQLDAVVGHNDSPADPSHF